MKKEYSLIELAKHYKCSKNSIIKWVKTGELRSIEGKFGSRITLRFQAEEVERFRKAHIVGNNMVNKGMKRKPNRKPIIKKGYRYIWDKSHPKADSDGYVSEHVLVVERRIGRHLMDDECVHHIDRNRINNSSKNLVLYKNQAEHMKEAHSFGMEIALRAWGNKAAIREIRAVLKKYEN